MPATPALVEHEAETLVMRRVVGIALVGEDLVDTTNSATFDAPKPPRHHTRHRPSPPPAGTLSVNPGEMRARGVLMLVCDQRTWPSARRRPGREEGDLYRGATATGADIDREARPPLRWGIANRIGPLGVTRA